MARDALLSILQTLDVGQYDFVTPTPATHARIIARPGRDKARSLRDVFGWSLPFAPGLLPAPLVAALDRAGVLEQRGALLASGVRVSRVGGALFLHSAFPTTDRSAVFLGPDSYRFADFIQARLDPLPPTARIADLGTGAGVGAVTAGLRCGDARLTLIDINRDALHLAEINAAHASLPVTVVESDGLNGVDGTFDLILANPPFIMDAEARAYRHGGDMHGARISLDWAMAATTRLAPGGRLLMYTGSAIVDGRDALRAAIHAALPAGCTVTYRERDPDIFGEELDEPAYGDVERIAAVGIEIMRVG